MEITTIRMKENLMYSGQTKKISIIAILKILYEHSDAEHRLSAQEIIDYLRKEYEINLDRKAVKRNLLDLMEFGYDINHNKPTPKKTASGEEEFILTGWYINHTFDTSELRLLIDSLLFSKHIPYRQCRDLIDKLIGLSSGYFKDNVKHISNLPENFPRSEEMFSTIDILDEAISKKKQVSFNYAVYGLDKKQYVKLNKKDGEPTTFKMNPSQMVATNGRYYLICNLDKHVGLAHYRVDRITNIRLLTTPRLPLNKVKGAERGFDLPKHMAEHIYMFTGESIRVRFKAKPDLITDLIDWFGKDFDVKKGDDDTVEISVLVNESAMFFWALLYGTQIEVVSPKSLRDKLAKATAEMAEKYNT